MQVTYPLDTLRLRIAVDPSMRGIRGASTALFREGSYNAFFRGLTASLIGTVLWPLLSGLYTDAFKENERLGQMLTICHQSNLVLNDIASNCDLPSCHSIFEACVHP